MEQLNIRPKCIHFNHVSGIDGVMPYMCIDLKYTHTVVGFYQTVLLRQIECNLEEAMLNVGVDCKDHEFMWALAETFLDGDTDPLARWWDAAYTLAQITEGEDACVEFEIYKVEG